MKVYELVDKLIELCEEDSQIMNANVAVGTSTEIAPIKAFEYDKLHNELLLDLEE